MKVMAPYLCVSVSKSNPATYNLHLKYITTREREMQRSTGDTSGLRDRNTKAHGNDVRSARGSTPDVLYATCTTSTQVLVYEYALMFHVSNACVESKFQPFSERW